MHTTPLHTLNLGPVHDFFVGKPTVGAKNAKLETSLGRRLPLRQNAYRRQRAAAGFRLPLHRLPEG